jgi:two-component system, OmpR family, sensor kinase
VSLRRRVLRYLALAATASCALTVAVAVVLVRHRIAAQRLSALEAQASVVAAIGSAPGALTPGDHVYGVGTGRPRRLGLRRGAAVLAAIPAGFDAQGSASADGRDFLYATRPTASGRIVLVRSAHIAFAEWRPFLGSLILAGLGGALLAVVLSYLLARRLTRPIGQLSAATRRLASGEAVVVPVGGEDELAGLAKAFNEMSGELSRARESQRRFLESVSHELKTPLTSIRGYAEALQEDAVTPTDGARVIRAEADRLERLVFDLLDLARLGRPGFSVARDPVDLQAVARQAVERHLPSARAMSVHLSSSSSGQPRALGDEDRILQATSNLIENALRMTPAGGSVTLSVAPGLIAVCDTGPGLAEEDIPRAFERFHLHRRYRSERVVGSGLGLAIVKELVTAMGGAVEAASPRGGGAQFVVRLPTPTAMPARCGRSDADPPSA